MLKEPKQGEFSNASGIFSVPKNDPITVVITGASSGIARATALKFASRQDNLVLLSRNEEGLKSLVKECKRGGKAIAVPADVAKEEEVENAATKAVDTFGKIDVWVNAAAVFLTGPFEKLPIDDFRQVLTTNLFGYLYGARTAVSRFREQGYGTLINVSSVVGLIGQPFCIPYVMSKAGIRGMSISLAQELSDEKNIHVCTVYPSAIDTPIYQYGGNYMGKALQPPTPRIDAEKVAQKIVGLTRHPKTEVIVGGQGKLVNFFRLLTPRFFDSIYRKRLLDSLFQDKAVEPTSGNIYASKTREARVSGDWKDPDKMNFMLPDFRLLLGAVGLGFLVRWTLKKYF